MASLTRSSHGLEELVRMAVPLLKSASEQNPRKGPGAKPKIPDYFLGAMIFVGVLKLKKSKSSAYRFLSSFENASLLKRLTGQRVFPSRSTFFDRYRRVYALMEIAIKLQGEKAIKEKIASPKHLAIDKSIMRSKGRPLHKSDRHKKNLPKGIDFQAAWGYSGLRRWVYGYSYEVVVCSSKRSLVFPLIATVSAANAAETTTAIAKVSELPKGVCTVSADSGYDSNKLAECIELHEAGRPNGRKFLCPENPRNRRPVKTATHQSKTQKRSRELRQKRNSYFQKPQSQRVYKQRTKTVEPFNSWFKSLFSLERVWHRGLDNNRTTVLTAIFCYQLLIRANFRKGNTNAKIKHILDAL